MVLPNYQLPPQVTYLKLFITQKPVVWSSEPLMKGIHHLVTEKKEFDSLVESDLMVHFGFFALSEFYFREQKNWFSNWNSCTKLSCSFQVLIEEINVVTRIFDFYFRDKSRKLTPFKVREFRDFDEKYKVNETSTYCFSPNVVPLVETGWMKSSYRDNWIWLSRYIKTSSNFGFFRQKGFRCKDQIQWFSHRMRLQKHRLLLWDLFNRIKHFSFGVTSNLVSRWNATSSNSWNIRILFFLMQGSKPKTFRSNVFDWIFDGRNQSCSLWKIWVLERDKSKLVDFSGISGRSGTWHMDQNTRFFLFNSSFPSVKFSIQPWCIKSNQ